MGFFSPSRAIVITAFRISPDTDSTIFSGTTNCGKVTGVINTNIIETIINGITYFLLSSSDNTGWFLAHDSFSQTSYTGDTHTNTTIDNIASTAGMYVGQAISGTNIAANTRIASVSATSITTTIATTGTTAGVTITKTPVAKIIDSDFPLITGPFAEMDGYVFVCAVGTNKIHNSNINSIENWDASNFIAASISTDTLSGVYKIKNLIWGIGGVSCESFYNAGNSFGSPLSSNKSLNFLIGADSSTYISQFNDYIFFRSPSYGVYLISQEGIKKISNPEIDRILANITVNKFAPYHLFGKMNLYVAQNGGQQWLYSLSDDSWNEQDYDEDYFFFSAPNSTGALVYAVSSSSSSGKLFYLSSGTASSFTDDGTAYTLTIQTQPHYFNDGLPFIIDDIELLADTQSSGSTTLATSADDYANFGTIGSFDLTVPQKRLPAGGYYDSNVAFRLTDSGNNAWRGQALKVTWRPA
jgi:hypothetical protein